MQRGSPALDHGVVYDVKPGQDWWLVTRSGDPVYAEYSTREEAQRIAFGLAELESTSQVRIHCPGEGILVCRVQPGRSHRLD